MIAVLSSGILSEVAVCLQSTLAYKHNRDTLTPRFVSDMKDFVFDIKLVKKNTRSYFLMGMIKEVNEDIKIQLTILNLELQ